MSVEEGASENSPLLVASGGFLPRPNDRKSEIAGLVAMCFSSFFFSVMAIFVKYSGQAFPSMEIVFIRSIIQFVLAIIMCRVLQVPTFGVPGLRWALFIRGFFGAIGLAMNYYAITQLYLADATVLFFISPVLTAVLARIFLKEPYGIFESIACLLCTIGFLLIGKPSFLFGDGFPNSDDVDAEKRKWAIGASLLGATMSSISVVMLRQMGKTAHFMTHVVYFGGSSILFSGFFTFFLTESSVPNTALSWVVLLVIGVTAFVGQSMQNKGVQLAPAGPIMLMRNFDIVFAFLFGILLFKEVPDSVSIIGTVLIIGGTLTIGVGKWFGFSKSGVNRH
ncbi:hypothetical protein K493DRAFT_340412 [Basidiobolus meristosporus CBS 931.73]|uniref:EamA domain-containing protein n=1 Tax=Basidiobolus meristosporus CBS 931.73 TaxID=1314790 RepID=A0A1Y1XVJ9_9FUNG|nr:hypothetical protein K493DRAFT_340412 [Basidiobolus meristosporus CBS 931.73]|eukprot:ORX89778.1 hypothetical protein K493DRAFT_340412 [Basidiobolus meristosporus CBS 931.73]